MYVPASTDSVQSGTVHCRSAAEGTATQRAVLHVLCARMYAPASTVTVQCGTVHCRHAMGGTPAQWGVLSQ